ncbi:MAG: hypothetical protein LAT54_01600 [Cryomorphaceae bacterium]|nr:hypothetical protein [Cryomorphaceae bacterium]
MGKTKEDSPLSMMAAHRMIEQRRSDLGKDLLDIRMWSFAATKIVEDLGKAIFPINEGKKKAKSAPG